MLVAQLGGSGGGSTLTAAVVPSTECRPRVEMEMVTQDVLEFQVGRWTRRGNHKMLPPNICHSQPGIGKQLTWKGAQRCQRQEARAGQHSTGAPRGDAWCESGTLQYQPTSDVSGCTEWHSECTHPIIQLLA